MSLKIDGSCNCVGAVEKPCCNECAFGLPCVGDICDTTVKTSMCVDTIIIHFDQYPTGLTNPTFPGFVAFTTDPVNHPLMIFDSANPTLGYESLGTPNQTIGGGPGIGIAGQAGMPGENAIPQYQILIISAAPPTPLTPTPYAAGGLITFQFAEGVKMREVHLLNVTAPGTKIQTRDIANNVVDTAFAFPLGLNSFQIVKIGQCHDPNDSDGPVRTMTIMLQNDAAICKIIYDQCPNPAIPCVDYICEDWSSFVPGAINPVFSGGTVTSSSPVLHPVMIFDSAVPSAGNFWLGSPNNTATPPGPGVGAGGQVGQPGENLYDEGHLLIISADANPLAPNSDPAGGEIIITFTSPVLVREINFLNVDTDNTTIVQYDASSNPIDLIRVPNLGTNSFQKVPTPIPYLTSSMTITLTGMAGIGTLCYAVCESGQGQVVIVNLPDNAMTHVNVPSTAMQGTYMLLVKSANPDGAAATFMAACAYNAQGGSIARLTSAPSITDETVNIAWPMNGTPQLYHDILKTGGTGALIPYNVHIYNV